MQPIPFQFDNTRIRAITDDQGNPWFVAGDVCKALEINDTSMAVKRLDDDEKVPVLLVPLVVIKM